MKRLIILMLLMVPVSLIAKDVGLTTTRSVNTDQTISINYTPTVIVTLPCITADIYMFDTLAPTQVAHMDITITNDVTPKQAIASYGTILRDNTIISRLSLFRPLQTYQYPPLNNQYKQWISTNIVMPARPGWHQTI